MSCEQFLRKPPAGTLLNCAHPQARGLVCCLLMNEPGWRAYDLSPYKNHGTLVGFDNPPKRSSLGPELDGLNDYINAGSKPSLNTINSITVEALVKPNVAADYTKLLKIAYKHDSGWYISITAAGQVFFRTFGLTAAGAGSTSTVPKGSLTHVVGTYNGNNVEVYINGVREGSVAAAGTIASTVSDLRIGTSIGAINVDDWFNGAICLYRQWSIGKTAREVKDLYLHPYDMFIY